HCECMRVESHGFADDGGIGAESPVPETVAQDQNFRSVPTFFRGQEKAAELRLGADHRQEIRSDLADFDLFRFALLAGERAALRPNAAEFFECAAMIAQKGELRTGSGSAAFFAVDGPDDGETIFRRIRKRAQ